MHTVHTSPISPIHEMICSRIRNIYIIIRRIILEYVVYEQLLLDVQSFPVSPSSIRHVHKGYPSPACIRCDSSFWYFYLVVLALEYAYCICILLMYILASTRVCLDLVKYYIVRIISPPHPCQSPPPKHAISTNVEDKPFALYTVI